MLTSVLNVLALHYTKDVAIILILSDLMPVGLGSECKPVTAFLSLCVNGECFIFVLFCGLYRYIGKRYILMQLFTIVFCLLYESLY